MTINPRDVENSLADAMPKELSPEDLQEAPASATVHMWDKDNFGVLFTIRDMDARMLFGRVTNFIKVAKLEGWKPDWKNGEVEPERVLNSQAAANKPAPMCSIHGTPMVWKSGQSKKTGKPYAFWSCETKLADGSFCNGKPMEK